MPQRVGSMPAHWFKCIGRKLRRFLVCNKKFSWYAKVVTYKINFRHQFDFPFHIFIKSWLILIHIGSRKQHGSRERKSFWDLLIRFFWYHGDYTKRNPGAMLCSDCPINNSSGYLNTTVYLAVMLKASWHTAEGN